MTRVAAARQAHAIDRFWSWWLADGAALCAGAVEGGRPERVVGVMRRRLHAVHPHLVWEFGTAPDGRHLLLVTSAGRQSQRAVLGRWLQGAPTGDPSWSYAVSRAAAPDADDRAVCLRGATIDVRSARVVTRVCRDRLDVTVYHPSFGRIPSDQRALSAFMLVDTVLGDQAVDTWVGSVVPAIEPPDAPLPLVALPGAVDGLQAHLTDADGHRPWQVRRWTTDAGDAVLCSTQVPLRPVCTPHLDTHVRLEVPYLDAVDSGLPTPPSLTRLRNFQERLDERAGEHGRLVAHETRAGVRTLHVYLDGTSPAFRSTLRSLRELAGTWPDRRITITNSPDPNWDAVQHLRA